MKWERDRLRWFYMFLFGFDVFWTTKERTDSSNVENMYVSTVHDF
jgi:hypothetical protein